MLSLHQPKLQLQGPTVSYADITSDLFKTFLYPDDLLLHPGQEYLLFLGEGAA